MIMASLRGAGAALFAAGVLLALAGCRDAPDKYMEDLWVEK